MNLNSPEIHPSQFQSDTNNIKSNLKNDRTLLSIRKERGQTLAVEDFSKLISPGKYNFTDNDQELSGSNTSSMFKNLYGETLLTFLFFSSENVNNIQKLIRMLVYKETKKVVDDQSTTELLVIMRSIFLAYSEHPKLIDETMSQTEKDNLISLYTAEVHRLNQLVIDTCVPMVVSQLQQYLIYLYDSSNPLKIMDKPLNTSVSGTKNYRSQTQVLLGSEL